MGTSPDHRRFAEECVVMAQSCKDANDKALWITLAQSWVLLAEHVARTHTRSDTAAAIGKEALKQALALQSAD
jgi:hypothetical protein